MGPMSTRWSAFILAAFLTATVSCSHAPPIVEPAITCAGQLVSPDNIKRIEHDLGNLSDGGEADLLAWLVADGPTVVACLIEWYVQNGTLGQKTAASRFKAGHKAQLAGPSAFLLTAPPGMDPGQVTGGGG